MVAAMLDENLCPSAHFTIHYKLGNLQNSETSVRKTV